MTTRRVDRALLKRLASAFTTPGGRIRVPGHDVHPEAFCDQCGRPNIMGWFSPEWNDLVDRDQRERLILCPVCFAALDPGAVWKLTRHVPNHGAVASSSSSVRSSGSGWT